MNGTLVLRDIHQPPAPSWWPPAPGWWLLAFALLLLLGVWLWWRGRRARRRQEIERLFDLAVAAATTPAGQVAAMSELLRRAARRHDASADRLHGEAWLQFLDGPPARARRKRSGDAADFAQGAGRLLLDGGYRRDVDAGQVEALRLLARRRFLQWMDLR